MSQLLRLIRAMSGPLVADERTIRAVVQAIRERRGDAITSLHADFGPVDDEEEDEGPPQQSAGIAVIPIYGAIDQRPHSFGTSVLRTDERFSWAIKNPNVGGILLDIASPGGVVDGVPELADKILAARGQKPIVAVANSLTASAAYWIAASADEIVVTPSGEVGSIGVYMLHEDWSKNLEQEGIRLTAIKAGKFKVEGAPWSPLEEETLAFYQARVDEIYGWFVKHVAKARGDTPAAVRSGYGEGRVLGAKQAVDAKLADRVATFDETLERMQKRTAKRRGPSAETLQRRLAVDIFDRE